MRDNGCVVSDVAMAHGGKQEILTSSGVKFPLIIKNGLPYLEHFYPTAKQMDEITREEFMTSRNTWDPTNLDSPEGESERLIKAFSPIPADIIDSFYNDQGDIRATKSDSSVDSRIEVHPVVVDSEVDSKTDPVVIESEIGPAAVDSEVDSKADPVVVESEVGPAAVRNERYQPKPNGKEHRSKPKKKKKKKRNQRQWNNNKKKIRWKDQPHIPSFPDHLLPTEGVPTDVAKEMKSILE